MDYSYPYTVGKLPFIYKTNCVSSNDAGIPDSLNFELGFNPITGVMSQIKNSTTEQYLDKVYKIGSKIIGHMDDYASGKMYSHDFLDFIINKEENLTNKTILEIGCGTGFLLKKLKDYGAEVIGIEPGENSHKAAEKYNVEIISDYFPSPSIQGKFDIIIFYNVLEHIRDLGWFLLNVKNQLKSTGRIYFAVPDCERAIKIGDNSILIHEHIHYFTQKTLKNMVYDTLKVIPTLEKSKYGSEINAMIKLDEVMIDYSFDLEEC